MALARLCVAFLALFKLVQAQSGCECVGLPCQSLTAADQDCIKVPRPDCPCCLVCALNEGQICDDFTRPCDVTQGLFCNSTSKICERGKFFPRLLVFDQGRKNSKKIDPGQFPKSYYYIIQKFLNRV